MTLISPIVSVTHQCNQLIIVLHLHSSFHPVKHFHSLLFIFIFVLRNCCVNYVSLYSTTSQNMPNKSLLFLSPIVTTNSRSFLILQLPLTFVDCYLFLNRVIFQFQDEPTSGMDPVSRRFLWNTLTSILQRNDRSIILTSHKYILFLTESSVVFLCYSAILYSSLQWVP